MEVVEKQLTTQQTQEDGKRRLADFHFEPFQKETPSRLCLAVERKMHRI